MARLLFLALALAAGCDGEVSTSDGRDGAAPRADGSTPDGDGGTITPRDGATAGDASTTTDAGPTPGVAPTGLDAYAANAAVGLDWDEVPGATAYNLYWSNTPGVSPATGLQIAGAVPGHVHRGLENGTPHYYVVTAVVGGVEGPPSAEASATPGGEFALHTLGTGRIDAIATDETVDLPFERRIHLLVLAEGYLESELARFTLDVGDYHDEVFALDPYSHLEQAFVLWYLPRASMEHVAAGSPQSADTAFRVPLTSDGRGIADVPSDGPTAARVWSVLDAFPYGPTEFYPSGGRTSRTAKGVVVHILVYDASRMRSGLSGRARRLDHPSDPTRVMSAAIAHGRPHELSHALGRLTDEYLDVAITGLGASNAGTDTSSGVSNVVADNDCATIPWRHLLAGGAINPSVTELVGAFGTSSIGYHPEFKCQMNGSHDNGMFYGGDDLLRVDRFCNFCRELLAFRILEHTRVLADTATSFETWAASYRMPFYDAYGFSVPATVPQENSLGEPRYEACVP